MIDHNAKKPYLEFHLSNYPLSPSSVWQRWCFESLIVKVHVTCVITSQAVTVSGLEFTLRHVLVRLELHLPTRSEPAG